MEKIKKDNGYMPEIMEEINRDYEAIETLLTAYEKEKETSHYIQSQLDLANAKLVEEKEKNKEHKQRITYLENKIFNQKQTIKEGGIKQY